MQNQINRAFINRDETVDIMKGFLILLMVAGHAQIPIHRFIYLFHMPVFFMITGWLYNYERNDINIKDYTLRKVKSLYLPYIKYGVFFVLLSILCPFFFKEACDGFSISETLNRLAGVFLFQGRFDINGPSWFVFALFFATVIFNTLYKYLNIVLMWGAVLSIFIITYYFINSLTIGLMGSALLTVSMGYFIKIAIRNIGGFSYFVKLNIPLLVGSFLVLLIMLFITDNEVRMAANQLVNPGYFIIGSFIGFIFVYQTAKLISRTPVSSILIYLGRHSLVILFLHLLAFKLISYIQILVYHLDISLLSKHPVACVEDHWWILYMLSGILLPLLFEKIMGKFRFSNNSI